MSNDSFSWSDMAQLTHATQVQVFNYCGCEDKESWYPDCPKEEENA